MKLATARHFFLITLLLGGSALTSFAQGATQITSQTSSPAYKVGERLTYNISFSSFVSAAHIELLVAARGTFFGREGIQLKGHVETIGTVNAALYAINNDYITYVEPATGLPYYGQQIVRAASRTSETAAEFSQPAGTTSLADKQEVGFLGSYDFLSTVYRVRALPLQEGESYKFSVRGESQTYEIEVKVKGRLVIRTNVGSFDSIVTEVRVKNDSRANGYGIRVYFSNDPRHVPVLLTAKHSAGEIRAELAGSEFSRPQPGATPTPAPVTPVQPGPRGSATSPGDDGALASLPFRVGEQLNYQIFLPSIAQPAAQATFQVRARSKYFDRDGLLYTLEAQTTNALQHLFFATDVINSYVDPKTLLPFQTELNLVEGRLRTNSKLKINQDHGSATTDRGDRIEIPVGTHDYLSFFYALRLLDLTPPRRSAVSILVNNKPKTLFISALSKEPVKIGSQTIPAIQVSLTTDDAEGDKYQLKVWISDDRRHLPIRITATTKLGALRADLAIIPVTNQ